MGRSMSFGNVVYSLALILVIQANYGRILLESEPVNYKAFVVTNLLCHAPSFILHRDIG